MVRPRSPFAFVLSLVAASVLVAACSSEPDEPPPLPTSFFSSPTPTTTGASGPSGGVSSGSGPTGGITGGTGALPSGPTGGSGGGPTDPGDLSRGALSIRVGGDLHATNELRNLISDAYDPSGGIALVWTAGGTDATTVGIGGLSFVGTQPTSASLTLTITVPSPSAGFESFVSFDGECVVTLDAPTARQVTGGFRCSSLRSSTGVTISATATFVASG